MKILRKMKPFVGITSYTVNGASIERPKRPTAYEYTFQIVSMDYVLAVIRAGGVPVVIPPTTDETLLESYVEKLDGFIFTGGDDISPYFYGESPVRGLGTVDVERDIYELKLIKMILDRKKPLLAICRGIQVLNVALGGTLYQDLPTEHPSKINHSYTVSSKSYPSHYVRIDEKSKLAKITGTLRIAVNSFHHQAIKTLGKGLRAVAWSDDDIVEAVELEEENFVLGVQWHPETMTEKDIYSQKIFNALINEIVIKTLH
ncbi:MAG: gamma-glutamyl-gamma-aminobutyrate hydrolase family protein [Thermoprotei archaeon]|jgi:putative glutamine amidotransferase